jgi:hypothetical protein
MLDKVGLGISRGASGRTGHYQEGGRVYDVQRVKARPFASSYVIRPLRR